MNWLENSLSMNKNQYLFVTGLLVLLLFFSCKKNKDKITTDPQAILSFSQTQITFDTIFTSVGSITKRLWVYNDNVNALSISSIALAGQSSSAYKLIIDGDEVYQKSNFLLKGRDSMQLLIRVLIDPMNQATPYLVEDSIVFTTNGMVQDVDLIAYGQDAKFITNMTLDCGTVWTNIKPYVLTGAVTVPAGCTLTVDKGTKVLFHNGASLLVDGTLLTLGEKDSIIQFKQDKLTNYYKNVPGQWKGVVIHSGSKNNKLRYTEIMNAESAFILEEEIDGDTIPELMLENTIVKNCSKDAIVVTNSDFYAVNSLLSNSIGYLVNTSSGGNVYLDYCTLANYSYDFFRDVPILNLSNQNSNVSNALVAKFRNVIVWGDKTEELTLSDNGTSGFDFTSTNCLYKSSAAIIGINNLLNQDPKFESEVNQKFFLTDTSPAIDSGILLPLYTEDLLGVTRDANPDRGCYEKE